MWALLMRWAGRLGLAYIVVTKVLPFSQKAHYSFLSHNNIFAILSQCLMGLSHNHILEGTKHDIRDNNSLHSGVPVSCKVI
jgi:hypothetical protein